MANTKIPTYKEINAAIKKIADIPSRVDEEGFVIADGVSLTKNVYDLKNGAYELHVRDAKNNKWKSFDTEDGADCVERAAKCFVDFYKAKNKGEAKNKKSESAPESDCIQEFRSWLDAQEGEPYNEQEITDFGWEWKSQDVGYPNGYKTYYEYFSIEDNGVTYRLEVAWNSFNDTIVGNKIWQDSSKAKKSEGLEDESEEVQQMVKELAEKTGNDIADVRSVNSDGGETCLVFGDEEEYRCFADYSDAERASNDGIKDMLDAMGIEGIRFENIGGIEKFVNTDWFDAALREYAENYISDIKHEPGRYEDEYGDMAEEDAVEKFIDEVGGGDAVEWFKSDFGDDYFSKVVMDNNLVDVDALAEAITEADGPANELAVYDGKEIELPCGYFCYRIN